MGSMMGIRAELRKWLQWRARRGYTHIFGVAEHTLVGTVTASDDACWTIEHDDGRLVYIPVDQFTIATDLRVGDRVEVQPIMQGGPVIPGGWVPRGSRWGTGWMIVRKLEPQDPKPKK